MFSTKPTKGSYRIQRMKYSTGYDSPLFAVITNKPIRGKKDEKVLITFATVHEAVSVYIDRQEASYVIREKFRKARKEAPELA